MRKLKLFQSTKHTSHHDHDQLDFSFPYQHGIAFGVGRHGQVKRHVKLVHSNAQRPNTEIEPWANFS